MKKFTVLSCLLALFFTWVTAQTYNVTVSGQVTELGTGNPVPNQPVDVWVDSSAFFGFGYFNTVLTDANGNYSDVIAVPGSVSQGTGGTGTRDCTPAGYMTNAFTFNGGSTTISGQDFQICTTTSGCSASFTASWAQGTTLVSYTDLSSGGTGVVGQWYWDFGDGNSSTQQNPTHAYNALGTYVVCLTIVTSQGCQSTWCDSVYVGGPAQGTCTSTLTAQTTPMGATTFTATGTSSSATVVSYFYDFGDGNTLLSSNATETHTYAASGTYIACVDILFSDSCMSRSCVTVTIGGMLQCQASFVWYPDTTGQYSIIVVNTSSGQNLTYSWSFGDGTGSTQAYPTHTYAGPGTYVVCLTVADNQGCTSTFCDSLVVVNKVNTPFTINVVSPATSVTPINPVVTAVSLYPSPANRFLQVDVVLAEAAPVAVALYDLSGRAVAVEDMGLLGSGKHGVRLATDALAGGLYLARVTAGGEVRMEKVMVAH